MTKPNQKFLLNIFSEYKVKNLSDHWLITSLYEYENVSKKSIWFRFFLDDNLVHTVSDISSDLHRNKNYIQDCIDLAIDNPKHFIVHFG